MSLVSAIQHYHTLTLPAQPTVYELISMLKLIPDKQAKFMRLEKSFAEFSHITEGTKMCFTYQP